MEKINNICHIGVSGNPFRYVMQYLWNFQTKPPERDNHLISYTPDDEEKGNPNLVEVFKIKNIKINQNGTNNN